MSGNFGQRYSLPELLRLEAANTLAGVARSKAIRDLAEISDRPRSAVREMANKMRAGRDVFLLQKCWVAQAAVAAGMVPVRKYKPRAKRLLSQPVAPEIIPAHSGGELTKNWNQE